MANIEEVGGGKLVQGEIPELATQEMLEFYADQLLWTGLKEIGEILNSPRVVTETVDDHVKVLETTPDVKVRAVSTLVTTRKLLMAMNEKKQKERGIEIPEEYKIED